MCNEYITTEEYINATRSPPLQPSQINYRSTETPPPPIVIIVDDNGDSSHNATETEGEGVEPFASKSAERRPRPSLCDSLLIKLLGPDYPEVAFKAAREFITLSPESSWEDRKPDAASTETQMVYDYQGNVSRTLIQTQVLKDAAFEASQKLNAAISKDRLPPLTTKTLLSDSRDSMSTRDNMAMLMSSGTRNTVDHRHHVMAPVSSSYQSPKSLNVKPPPRVCLPSIRTQSPGSSTQRQDDRDIVMATSPTLAKFAIGPLHRNSDHQLPRMQTSPSTAHSSTSSTSKQTLPSLETALSAISTSSDPLYSGRSPTLTRPSPVPLSHYGPSPSSYSNPSPASAISPPRMTTSSSYWRTVSRETSNSTPSEHASAAPSVGISTPASSIPGHSPAESAHTPGTTAPDTESRYHGSERSSSEVMGMQHSEGDSNFQGSYCGSSFKCTYPGCTALPFQTQYLLNSHANVHSNTRPHFCPVPGCPRGPAGQGFKRKNEMIRHGLVHQSPGYVCPFCPDQQHKYPRPDNLQRHVRVHHMERDRDDPLLRDVLAQRPEGGNRGRRKRLGP